MTAKLTIENFVTRANIIHRNEYNYSDVIYMNARIKITIKCLIHGKFEQTPDAHLHGQGCPQCKNIKIGDKLRFNNEYVDNFLNTHNNTVKRIGNYISSGKFLQFECLICSNKWETTTDHVIYQRTGCPHCSKFKNEKIVGDWLNKTNIKWNKICIKINGKRYYPDYFISLLNTVIEYNGDQHYRPVCFKGMSEEIAKNNFHKQLVRDEIMREYCKTNGLILLEIDGRKYKNKRLESFLHNYFNMGGKND